MSILIYEKGVLYTDGTGVRSSQTHDGNWFVPKRKLYKHQSQIAIATLGAAMKWTEHKDFLSALKETMLPLESAPGVGFRIKLPTYDMLNLRIFIMTKNKLYFYTSNEDDVNHNELVEFKALCDDGFPIALSSENATVNTLISLGYSARTIITYVHSFGISITRFMGNLQQQCGLLPLGSKPPRTRPKKPPVKKEAA